MPNFDAGHYFLTTLAPILPGSTTDENGETVSHAERLRTLLATLPTALQSPATERIGMQSPFARNLRTHLCRFVIIEDVVYNGRVGANGIVNAITQTDPIHPRPIDRLKSAYLLFVADIDAVTQEGDPLPRSLSESEQDAVRDSYARRLFETAEAELRQIYGCCVGFDAVSDAAGFASYLCRCQVETTMPFHDYWTTPPDLPTLPTTRFALIAGIPLGLLALSGIGWLTHSQTVPLLGWIFGLPTGPTAVVALIASIVAVAVLYRWAFSAGEQPFPPAAHGDLPSVLKALYVQQRFAEFAAQHQGEEPEALHRAFSELIEDIKPKDKVKRTQPPGVVGSVATSPGA